MTRNSLMPTSASLPHMTWFSVLLGTLAGAASGAVMGTVALIFLARFSFIFSRFDRGFLDFIGLAYDGKLLGWLMLMYAAVGGAGSFLGSVVGRLSRSRKYTIVTGAGSGMILGLVLEIVYFQEPLFSLKVIHFALVSALAGLLGSLYSTTVPAATHQRRHLPISLIIVLAIGLTILSFQYVRPEVCESVCIEEPCALGTCLPEEQRAGFPFAVFQDEVGGSPISGWGILGPEDPPNPLAFVLDVLFYSVILWLAWKGSLWLIRHVLL